MRNHYLQRMGIDVWVPRHDTAASEQPTVQEAVSELEPSVSEAAAAPTADAGWHWDELAAKVADCQLCALRSGCTQTVFGTGDRQARMMVIGEGPGAEEDRRGEPFVGRAGGLLNNMLRAMGFARNEVFIANVVKCRPPNNRDPQPEEAAACAPYLRRQIELVAPDVILAVGRVAAQNLLQTQAPLGRLRGAVHRLETRDTPVVVTYHPAYLLRSPADKVKAWQDLKQALKLLHAA
ncbi:uracil-DNA glycosylase family protein [Alkalilimnicola ehrlichii]|uniref:Type-4 uracil-DNA glycosylase n=1 Tax=Alkalilimnicola ehrlichii TaxID=351052 RepID=A0A3E0WYW6_9GAMM|nr:uracil-DNA glycosylase [Alkalilimnicola ehrlichii]RFA37998.1 uracil-DNA glycosylase [Alkalilimnicola ehrlichii]